MLICYSEKNQLRSSLAYSYSGIKWNTVTNLASCSSAVGTPADEELIVADVCRIDITRSLLGPSNVWSSHLKVSRRFPLHS